MKYRDKSRTHHDPCNEISFIKIKNRILFLNQIVFHLKIGEKNWATDRLSHSHIGMVCEVVKKENVERKNVNLWM